MLKKICYAAEYLMLCAVILIFWIITDMNGKLNPVVMPSPERVWDTLIYNSGSERNTRGKYSYKSFKSIERIPFVSSTWYNTWHFYRTLEKSWQAYKAYYPDNQADSAYRLDTACYIVVRYRWKRKGISYLSGRLLYHSCQCCGRYPSYRW